MSWIKITTVENFPVREGRNVKIGRSDVAVFNLGDRFAAIDNRCPHSGGPLCDGMVSGNTVVCPLHGWKVDLTSGAIVRPEVPVCVDVYPVKVEDGIVMVDFPTQREKSKEAAA
jgi:nitrite reductase (NADH) small subunit